jgi:hypothetical protein
MCSRLNVVSVQVQENPAKPTDPFKLEITFEVFEHIKEGKFQFTKCNVSSNNPSTSYFEMSNGSWFL